MSNFIIHALPRSRTAWLSKFLTYKDYTCYHEQAMNWRSIEDVKTLFTTPNTGSAETGMAQGWWLVQRYFPGIKTVVVKRPLEDVLQSLKDLDLSGVGSFDFDKLTKLMSYSDRMLDKISTYPGVLTVQFDNLKKMETCRELFEFVLPYKFDIRWWSSLKNQNIQINMKELIRYRWKYKQEITGFKDLCKQELRHLRKEEPENPLWGY